MNVQRYSVEHVKNFFSKLGLQCVAFSNDQGRVYSLDITQPDNNVPIFSFYVSYGNIPKDVVMNAVTRWKTRKLRYSWREDARFKNSPQ